MPCLLCNDLLSDLDREFGGYCFKCRMLEYEFKRLAKLNRKAAYNWAMDKALDLAGEITGIEPGSALLEIEDGELGIRTIKKVRTTVARSIPPELKNNDGRKEDE